MTDIVPYWCLGKAVAALRVPWCFQKNLKVLHGFFDVGKTRKEENKEKKSSPQPFSF
jgi:hypothetical protein